MVETRRLTGLQVTITYVSGGTGTDHLGGVFSTSFAYTAATDMYGSTPAATAKLSWTKAHYDTQGRADWTEQGWKENPTGIRTNVVYDPVTGRRQKTWFDLDLDGNGSIDTPTERHETTYFYDALGRPSAVRNAAGLAVSSRYDASGRLEYSIDNGVVAASVTPGGTGDNTTDDLKVQVVYDDRGRKAAEVDVLGRRTDYEYDDAGRLIAVTLPPVDADGSATGTVDRRRPRYEYHYDVQGNQTYVVTNVFLDEATGQVTYRTIALNGTVTDTTRGASAAYSTWPTDKGDVTKFIYDGAGRELSRTLPAGNLTGAPANSFKETLVYVSAAESTTVGGTWEKQYGQLKYRQDVEGRVTEFRYDSTTGAGRLVTQRYFASGTYNGGAGTPERTVTYKYDALGRRTQVVDSAFTATTVYTFDTDGHTTRIDSPQGTLNYSYDSRGRKLAAWTGTATDLATARTSATTLTEYAYDNIDRLISTTAVRRFGANVDADNNAGNGVQPEKTQTVFALDGQVDYELVATATGNLTRDYSYDTSHRRLTTLEYFADANSNHVFDTGEVLLGRFAYAYNNDGTRKSEVWTDVQTGDTKTTTTAWVYDDVNRLVKETYDGFDGQGAALNYTDTYAYDFSNNRTSLVHDDRAASGNGSAGPDATTTYTYDANDRLLTEFKDVVNPGTDTTTTYTYGSGNTGTDQTVKTAVTGTVTETTTFTYDAAGRMTNVQIAKTGFPTTSVAYKYNADGLRVERTVSGTTTVYHLDPGNPTGYVQVLEEGTDANANHKLDAAEVAKAYTLGMVVLTQATAAQVLHLLTDGHGSTRAVLDRASGPTVAGVVERYAYSGYGNDLGLVAAPKTDIRYAGQAIDPLTGLSFNRTRWYDRSSGRFLRLDSYAGMSSEPLTLNKYLYAGANPTLRVDPSGQFSITETIVSMGISSLIGYLLRPIIKPVTAYLTKALIPKWVGNLIDMLVPNVGIIGGGIALNMGQPDMWLGASFEVGVEGVISTETHKAAVFVAGTAKLGKIGENPGSISAFVGLGWRVKDSHEYMEPKFGLAVPFASLPRKWQNRVYADMSHWAVKYIAPFLQGVAAQGADVNVTSPGYTDGLIKAINSDVPDQLKKVLHFLDHTEATLLVNPSAWSVELLLSYDFLESANETEEARLDGLGVVGSVALQVWPWGMELVKFES